MRNQKKKKEEISIGDLDREKGVYGKISDCDSVRSNQIIGAGYWWIGTEHW